MTEEEAQTKQCCGPPIVAQTVLLSSPGAEVTNAAALGKCIASACMAWRWNPTADQVRLIRERGEMSIFEARTAAKSLQEPAKDGYCGLAGAPQ